MEATDSSYAAAENEELTNNFTGVEIGHRLSSFTQEEVCGYLDFDTTAVAADRELRLDSLSFLLS
ncbi:hypothetical protein RvY_08054 [Ramazzottius varieornatus]|uniref:Uncharacterized protein n=1 Tax=Ramazzottius varieornatus TaxID=947166 RepID=A0A1D1V991_RAMVA|nr:hypothetical protein RvY_08054 [Ramazzottius varieornatus]